MTRSLHKLTAAQRNALKQYAADFEAPDYAEYSDRAGAALGWLNRERVITALIRKGLIDDDQKITDAGREALK
jgi:hypothetical protein